MTDPFVTLTAKRAEARIVVEIDEFTDADEALRLCRDFLISAGYSAKNIHDALLDLAEDTRRENATPF